MNLIEFAQLLESKDVKEVMNVLSALEVKKEEKKEEEKEKPVAKQKRLQMRKQACPRMTITLTPENDAYVKIGASKRNMSWSLFVNTILDNNRGVIHKLILKGGDV